MIRLCACILHYGEPELTARLHTHLQKAEPERAQDVLVLDNAAPNAYAPAWHRLEENRYWAGAFAWFVTQAEALGYTHVWFCNNDIQLLSAGPYLKRLEARLARLERQGRVGALSPALEHNPYHRHMQQQPGGGCRPVPYLDGVAPVVNLEAVAAVGGLDCADNQYGYGVDVWLSLRLQQAGWQVLVEDGMLMRHRYHTTASAVTGFMQTASKAEEAFMRKRLGPLWREHILELQQTWPMGCGPTAG